MDRLLQQALLWLHDQEVMRLNRGMSVFRPAMTIRLEPDGNRFQRSDFEPLQIYHDEKTLQIHIMTEYAEKGLQSIADAVRLPLDYFRLPRADFIDRWLSNKRQELSRQTTPESWRSIVESLNNRAQRDIVTDDRQNTNVLVLGRTGLGRDSGAGAPYRLPHPRQEGGPPVHPCPGLQPARRRADQAAVTRPDRR